MTTVNLTPLKAKAISFPEPVKSLILSEPDLLDAAEFITKVGTFERLLAMQKETR